MEYSPTFKTKRQLVRITGVIEVREGTLVQPMKIRGLKRINSEKKRVRIS